MLPMNINYYAGLCIWLAAKVDMVAEGIIGDLTNVHLYENSIMSSIDLLNQSTDQERVDVKYDLEKESSDKVYPNHKNFVWKKKKVKMGKKYNVPMLTYSK